MVVSGVGGSVIVTEKVPSTSSGSGPPAKVTIVSPSTVSIEPSQPSTGSVTGSTTPSGRRMSSCTVGEPSQPCSTVKPTVSRDPACASTGSGSMWADARPPVARSMADVVAATRTSRRIMAPQGYGRRCGSSGRHAPYTVPMRSPTGLDDSRHRHRSTTRSPTTNRCPTTRPSACCVLVLIVLATAVVTGLFAGGGDLGARRRRRATDTDERRRRRVPAGHARPPRPGAADLQSVPRRPASRRCGAVRPRGHHVPDPRHRLDGGLARRGGLLPRRPRSHGDGVDGRADRRGRDARHADVRSGCRNSPTPPAPSRTGCGSRS